MGDPLSVAGTAVGIASLGIQVCQGLVSYLSRVNDRRGEITAALDEIKTLLSIFQTLKYVLPDLDKRAPDVSLVVGECLANCKDGVADLKDFLDKLGPSNSSGTKERIKDIGSTLVYPFRQEKLVSLQQRLRGLTSHLNAAIGIAMLKLSLAHQEGITATLGRLDIGSQSQNGVVRDVQSRLRANVNELRSLHDAVSDVSSSIERGTRRTECNIQTLDKNLTGKLTVIQDDTSGTRSEVRGVVELMKRVEEKVDAQSAQMTQLTRPPLMGSSQYAMTSDSDQHVIETSIAKSIAGGTQAICHCPKRPPSSLSYYLWGMRFEYNWQGPPKHSPQCPFYGIPQKAKKTVKAELPLRARWLTIRTMRACVSYTSGNGPIGLLFDMKNIVPRAESPVYSLMKNCESSIARAKNADEVTCELQALEHDLLSLYRDGKARPSDLDDWGHSHAAMFLMCIDTEHWRSNCNLLEVILSGAPATEAILRLLQILTQFGTAGINARRITYWVVCSVDRAYGSRSRSFCMLQRAERMLQFISSACEKNPIELSPRWELRRTIEALPSFAPSIVRELDVPPIIHAVLLRSIADLERCISRNSNAVMEKYQGWTTLGLCSHLAWPEGMRLLLSTEAGTLILSDHTRYHLELGLHWGGPQVVDLLMQEDCSDYFSGYLDLTSETGQVAPETIAVIARHIADRRRRLLRLAQQQLGTHLQECPSSIPDSMAAGLCAELATAGVHIPAALRVHSAYETIYQERWISLVDFPILSRHGFCGLQSYNAMGLTPVMIWRCEDGRFEIGYRSGLDRMIEALDWLCIEGSLDQVPQDPWQLGLNTQATGWHHIAARLGYSTYRPMPVSLLKKLSNVDTRDRCVCWCNASKGCSAYDLFWKGRLRRALDSDYLEHPCPHILSRRGPGVCEPDDTAASNTSVDLVRLLTFEALDMTHTCCTLGQVDKARKRLFSPQEAEDLDCVYWRRSYVIIKRGPQEVQEIRYELQEQQSARQLDMLMGEFTPQIKALDPSFDALEKFIWGPWRRRISELFAVDHQIVKEMGDLVGNVRTHVLPERVKAYLGPHFDLLDFSTQKDTVSDEARAGASSVERIGRYGSTPCGECLKAILNHGEDEKF